MFLQYIFNLFLLSCNYSSVEVIHGASSDATHSVCDCSVDRQLPLCLFFNKSDHPGLQSCNWPQCSPGPTSVSMVTLVHLLSPPEGVQRADEFGCCARCEDRPTQISVHPTISTAACTYTASPPRRSNFKSIVCFLPLCIQARAAVQWTRLIYLLTIF